MPSREEQRRELMRGICRYEQELMEKKDRLYNGKLTPHEARVLRTEIQSQFTALMVAESVLNEISGDLE